MLGQEKEFDPEHRPVGTRGDHHDKYLNAQALSGPMPVGLSGDIRAPVAISWPAEFSAGELRNQVAVNAYWMLALDPNCVR